MNWVLWIVIAYLCGSVPFGPLLAASRSVDLRKVGSGNIGATNLGRALGPVWGGLCFALDVLKGLLPVLTAGWAMKVLGHPVIEPGESWPWLAVAAAAVLGHVLPVWLKFRGGKGVATALGTMLGLYPILTLPGVAALMVWVLFVATFRYVSLASMAAAVFIALWQIVVAALDWQNLAFLVGDLRGKTVGAAAGQIGRAIAWWPPLPFAVVTTALAGLLVLRHAGNILRLVVGTEPRLGDRRESPKAKV